MLSLCLIARNEQANLARAIKSFAPLADEVILLDTGSTDDTPAIAQNLGAKVYHEPWCDDFSRSRNLAVARATGDWIFWLDADEALLVESQSALRDAMTDSAAVGFTILRQDIFDEHSNAAFTEMWQLRLFRRGLPSHFQGRCHPQFDPPLESIGPVKPAPSIKLRHWGYLQPLRKAKLERSARLLDLELSDRPGRFYYLVDLGRTLLLLGDAKAKTVLAQAAAMLDPNAPAPPEPMAACLLEYLLQLPADELPAGFTPNAVRHLAASWFPKSLPLLTRLARERFSAGDFAQAATLLERICQLSRTGDYDKSISFSPELLGSGPVLNLAVCHTRLGNLAQAQRLLENIANCPTNGPAARQNLKVVTNLRRQFAI